MFNFMTLQTLDIAMIIIWAIFVIAAIIIEFETANLVSIWFAAGGIAGIVCEKGEIKVEFQKWPAISKGENSFLVGDKVIITEIIGNKMIVDKIKEIDLN